MTLIARLRILLNDIDPQPMRHIEVPLKIRLDRLHEVVQAAMGWTDTHLYEFRVGDAGWGVPDPDGFYDGPMPAKKTTLEKLLEDISFEAGKAGRQKLVIDAAEVNERLGELAADEDLSRYVL